MDRFRLTVDTGGTFSDFVYFDEAAGAISVGKIPSTPDDPSRAILQGVEALIAKAVSPSQIQYFCHGTTVGTNALLEGKGVKTALLITKGFRGIYEVAEQARPHGAAIFDIDYNRPAMLAPPSLTIEVEERVAFDGTVLTPLNEPALRGALRALAPQKPDSVAVCLLFSFLHPAHERRVRDIVQDELPGCSVSLSCEISPQIREYYRLSTTVINAYLQPILSHYVSRLDGRLEGAGVRTSQSYIMQSNGGMATFAATAKQAVGTVLSGPAGGVTASVAASRATGFKNIITFDMGGTSCDVALIQNGEPGLSHRGKIDGRDISMPMMDINTVSAGGGTVSRVTALGALEVGPQSAGAVPGPACYGRGGTQPTITDCNLVLGYLGVGNFLGGGMRLDAEAAYRAVETAVARPLGLSVPAAAEGIIRIINVKMEEAIKAISTMRGHDLRDFVLLAFGGAGPIHAAKIAATLGMKGVLVPRYPGVFSAIGLLMSDVKHNYVQSRIALLGSCSVEDLDATFAPLSLQAARDLQEEGFAPARTKLERALDLRYAGQGYELTIPYEPSDTMTALRSRFDAAHKAMFGHSAPQEPVEIVSYRLQGTGLVPPITLPKAVRLNQPLAYALRERRPMWFDGIETECPVYDREKLDIGVDIPGPAVVEQFDCTTVIYPGQTGQVDETNHLFITNQETHHAG